MFGGCSKSLFRSTGVCCSVEQSKQSVRGCYDPANKDTYCRIQDKGMPTTAAARVTMAVHQLVDVLFVAAAGPIRVWYYL
jgi:hypothetical protein